MTVLVSGMDGGHTFLFHPYLAELFDVSRGCRFVEGTDEFIPRGILEHVVVQVFLQTSLHLWGPHRFFEHTQHNRSLVVDDIVVEQTGIAHVRQFLGDGVGAFCAVDGDGTRLIGFEEIQVVVDIWERAPDHL